MIRGGLLYRPVLELKIMVITKKWLLLLLFIACGCAMDRSHSSALSDPDYGVAQAKKTPSERAQFVRQAKLIKLGDSFESVVEILGKPTRDMRVVPKGRPKAPSVEVLAYYVSEYVPREPRGDSEELILTFNEDRNLKSIDSNIIGLPSVRR